MSSYQKAFKDSNLIECPSASPDINPMENMLHSNKRNEYGNGKENPSKEEWWKQ